MTKLMSVFVLYFFVPSAGRGQAVFFKDLVFPRAEVQKDLSYRAVPPGGKPAKAYRFDLYTPGGPPAGTSQGREGKRRPLILWMHGGGFKFGSKNARGMRIWATGFARRGYVCAAINYRLSRKNALGNFKDLVRGCSDAVDDTREAVRYFRDHADEWGIDTGRIILAGNSAGGMIALQAAFSTRVELARVAGDSLPASALVSGSGLAPGSAGLSVSGSAGLPLSSPTQREGVAAVINFWGALFDTAWLANARVPIVSVHGSRDRIVPIRAKGEHFFGSEAIHLAADRLSQPNRISIYDGYGHELERHFNPLFTSGATKRRWMEAGQFAADFLYATLFR